MTIIKIYREGLCKVGVVTIINICTSKANIERQALATLSSFVCVALIISSIKLKFFGKEEIYCDKVGRDYKYVTVVANGVYISLRKLHVLVA